MISSYFHQEKIFHTARNILGNNMTSQFESVMHTYTKGITIRDNECELCHSYLKFEAMVNLIVFKCGHIYHSKCLKEKRYCLICADKEAGELYIYIYILLYIYKLYREFQYWEDDGKSRRYEKKTKKFDSNRRYKEARRRCIINYYFV